MQLAGGVEAEPEQDGSPPPTTAASDVAAGVSPGVSAGVAAGVAAPAAPRRTKTWAERASASCARGLEDSRALLDGATKNESLLEVLGATVRVEGRVVRELDALPVPRAKRRQVREVVRLLDGQFRSGKDLLAALRVHWDDALIDRSLRANGRAAERMRLLFLDLGATGCAAYLQG
jgi:hypothetical protein